MSETSKSASTVLKELLEGKKLTIEQQLQVLEYRRDILTRCMKKFSQNTLGQLACMDSGNGFYHDLSVDEPDIVSIDDEFSLDSRGLYGGNMLSVKKDGKRYAFGTDHESWLLIEITYLYEAKDRLRKYERAAWVQVIRTDLPTILGEIKIDGYQIWRYFKKVTDEWVSNRKELYDQALKVQEGMREEGAIFSRII